MIKLQMNTVEIKEGFLHLALENATFLLWSIFLHVTCTFIIP